MPNIEQKLTYLNTDDKRRALQILDGIDKDIHTIIKGVPDDIVNGSSGRQCLFYAAYSRLLDIWPAAQFMKGEEREAYMEFASIMRPGDSEISDCQGGLSPFTLFNNMWRFTASEDSVQPLDMGFSELGHDGWKDVTSGLGISPRAIAFMDYMSRYFDDYKRIYRITRLMEETRKSRARKGTLSVVLLKAWKSKEHIISTPSLYTSDIPGCRSGTSFSGILYLPLGALLECWQNCPAFRLDDGRLVIRFASGLSGFTKGEAVNLSNGIITDFDNGTYKKSSRTALINESAQYRSKAKEMLKSGAVPMKAEELLEALFKNE